MIIRQVAPRHYSLEFPHLALFMVDPERSLVTASAIGDQPMATLDHLYHNQVLPLMRSEQGGMVLHGSGIVLGQGATAFLGMSGFGKSTLAASFVSNGQMILSDDALYVTHACDGTYALAPGHPSIRLWDDSRQEVLPNLHASADLEYTSKLRFAQQNQITFETTEQPLHAIYCLGDGSSTDVSVLPLVGSAAMTQLLKNTFILDIKSPTTMRRVFQQLTALLSKVPCFMLDYPRRYDALADVRKTIEAHVRTLHVNGG